MSKLEASAKNNRYVMAAWLVRMAQALERGCNAELVAKRLRAKAEQVRPNAIAGNKSLKL